MHKDRNIKLTPIPGFEKEYAITKCGQIWSYFKNDWKMLENLNGYRRVGLHKNGKLHRILVHRLVMLTFVGASNLQVNHINGIKNDNRLENLEYVTISENLKHAHRIGLRINRKGELNGGHVLKEQQVYKIRFEETSSLNSIAKKYGVSKKLIFNIKHGKAWTHITEDFYDN